MEDETNQATKIPGTDRNRDKAANRETPLGDERTGNHSSRKDKRPRNQLQTDTGWRPTDRKARRTRDKTRNIRRAWKTPPRNRHKGQAARGEEEDAPKRTPKAGPLSRRDYAGLEEGPAPQETGRRSPGRAYLQGNREN